MPLELQVFSPTPHSPRAREKTSPFSSQRNHSQFFRVVLVWRQGRREETSGCGQAWGGAEAHLSLGRPGLPAADMSAPPDPPPPGRLGTSWAHRPRCRPQPLRGKLTRGDGAWSPFPRHCRLPCPSPRGPAAHTHSPVRHSLHPALPAVLLHESCGDRRRSGGDEGGAGLGEGEGRQQPQENTHSLFSLRRRESPASYLFPASARLGAAQLDRNLQVSHFRRKHLGAHLPSRRPSSPRPSPPQLLDSTSRAF